MKTCRISAGKLLDVLLDGTPSFPLDLLLRFRAQPLEALDDDGGEVVAKSPFQNALKMLK